MNFQAGDIASGNFTIAKINQAGASADLSVYSSSWADVVGFYSRPAATALQCEDTTPISTLVNQGPFGSLYTGSLSVNACSAGYTQVALRCYPSSYVSNAYEVNGGTCGANSIIATTYLYASRRCCRIPGR